MIVLLVILGLLGFVLFLVLKNKQPVYLKPKKSKAQNGTIPLEKSNSTNESLSTSSKDVADSSFETTQTNANENNDVVRSELKALRQSAVAMSVSQKEGANQIVQDWLETEGGESDEGDIEDNSTKADSK